MKTLIISTLITFISFSYSFAQEYQGLYIIDSESQNAVMYIGAMTQNEHFSIDDQSLHFDKENLHPEGVAHANNILLMLEQFHFEIVEDKNGERSYYSFQSDKYHIDSRDWNTSLTIKD